MRNNNWRTVCDDFWDTADAQVDVARRQLGYYPTAGAMAHSSNTLGIDK